MSDEDTTAADAGSADADADKATTDQPGAGGEHDSDTTTTDGQQSTDDRLAALEARMAESVKTEKQLRKRAQAAEAEAAALRKASETEDEKRAREQQEDRERAERAESQLRSERVKNAVLAEAARKKALDPDAVFALIDHQEDEASLVSDDGQADQDAVAAAVDAMLKSKPFLVEQEGRAKGGSGEAANAERDQSPRTETDEERRQRLYHAGKGRSVFDPATATALGGGVVDNPTVRDQ